MNCPFCDTVNDDENTFCVSCGEVISQTARTEVNFPPPTREYPAGAATEETPPDPADQPASVETAYPPKNLSVPAHRPGFGPGDHPPEAAPTTPRRRPVLYAALGLLFFLVVGLAGLTAYFFWPVRDAPLEKAELLPDHYGMFVQNREKDKLTPVKRTDVADVLAEKEKLAEEDLPVWQDGESLILYADSREIPSADLRLIPLDSVADDGSFKEIDFQIFPVAGRPALKRLRVPQGLADGRYVFALLDGYLNEGKHRLWAFQATGANRENNDDIARTARGEMKKEPPKQPEKKQPAPKPPKTDKPVPGPPGSVVAYCNAANVLLRASPSLDGKKIGRLARGQRLYVIKYSKNYDNWQGTTANWAYIQTEKGARGWVFTPFVSY